MILLETYKVLSRGCRPPGAALWEELTSVCLFYSITFYWLWVVSADFSCIYIIYVATVTVVILCGCCGDGLGWVKRQNGGLGVAPVGAKSDASDMGSCYQFVAEDLWLCRRMRHRRRKQWHDGCVCLSMRLEPLFSFVLSNFSWSRLSYHRVIPQKKYNRFCKKWGPNWLNGV